MKKMMEKQYKLQGIHFDVAFVPLDPRQEDHYADGMIYFLENVECEAVFPMHYWDEPKVIDRFIAEYPKYKSRIRNTELQALGIFYRNSNIRFLKSAHRFLKDDGKFFLIA